MGAHAFAPVGVAVFGLSTLFGHWGFNAVHRIVEAIAGDTLHLHIANLAELRDGFGRRGGGSVVLTSDFPETDLIDFVCASDLPIVTFSEDLAGMLDWVRLTRLPDRNEAVRFCSSMVSSLAPAFGSERALRVIGTADSSPAQITKDIIEYLFPGRGEWLASSTFDHLIGAGAINPDTLVSGRARASSEPARTRPFEDFESYEDIGEVISGYSAILDGKSPQEIVWPQELFFRQDNRLPRAPFDLTGPARVLFYGPYMFLPVGNWVARVEFEIDGAVSGVEATTDVYINEVVIEKAFEMPAKGIFAFNLSFRVSDPRTAVQIRLFTRKSAIEGVFLPRSVRVRPTDRDDEPEEPPLSTSRR